MDPKFADFTEISEHDLASQRIYMHYAANNFFLGNNDILQNIHKINQIDTLIIHSRLDLVCPFKGAYDLSCNLKKVKLIVLPAFGHVNSLMRKTIRREVSNILK